MTVENAYTRNNGLTTKENITISADLGNSSYCWIQAKDKDYFYSKPVIASNYERHIKKNVPGVKKVIYNPPATIVFWSDNTKTTSKCDVEDKFDELTGFLLCVAKKYMGGERLMHSLDKNVY